MNCCIVNTLNRNRRRFRCNPRYWNSHGSSCASNIVAVKVDVYMGTSLLDRWEERLQDIFNDRLYDMANVRRRSIGVMHRKEKGHQQSTKERLQDIFNAGHPPPGYAVLTDTASPGPAQALR
ncbi:hypothetical protein NC651_000156 [Populus alba x Populus x berolinensis]|nr:hypothetical protein NC651_000156 [Populus alba x Populus x berolinensis]